MDKLKNELDAIDSLATAEYRRIARICPRLIPLLRTMILKRYSVNPNDIRLQRKILSEG